MNHIQITIAPVTVQQQEILVALLNNAGFEGFEELTDTIHAFVPEERYNEDELLAITTAQGVHFTKTVVPMQNWNELWETSFEPVTIEGFAGIRASFHPPMNGVEHEIVITPKMSFGTGHHATTYLMMLQMRDINFKGKSVFDFGTGTGILAILAEQLGAREIQAIDNDEYCLLNGQENIAHNNCSRISLSLADNLEGLPAFDIILANINKNVILDNFNQLRGCLAENGVMLLSGLLVADEKDILHVAKNSNLLHQHTVCRDKWICMVFNG